MWKKEMTWKDSFLQALFLTGIVFMAKTLTELIYFIMDVLFK
jgi:hypothetical protein